MPTQIDPIQMDESARKLSSKRLNRQIGIYSLAASAAGVGMLALAQPAQSEVVVTRKTVAVLPSTFVGISFANNGINDFSAFMSATFSGYSTKLAGYNLSMRSLKNGEGVVGSRSSRAIRPNVSALPRGAAIGPSANFVSSAPGIFGVTVERSFLTYQGVKRLVGEWEGNPRNRYVGVRFLLNGETHYGWVRLTVITSQNKYMSAKITAYAYETVANKAIVAGTAGQTDAPNTDKPTAEVQAPKKIQGQNGPSLGMLAVGAKARPIWRREETAADSDRLAYAEDP